jgi:peptidoglycan hydrolase-like protein with peptidoglycan-binding domain
LSSDNTFTTGNDVNICNLSVGKGQGGLVSVSNPPLISEGGASQQTGGGVSEPAPAPVITIEPVFIPTQNPTPIQPPLSPLSGGRTLRLGNSGEDVKVLQTYLHITADGIFGKQTKAAVIKFQLSKSLKIDGVVGPLTREEMK